MQEPSKAEVEALLRETVQKIIAVDPTLDAQLQIADLPQAKLLLHEVASIFAQFLSDPIMAMRFGPDVVAGATSLAAVAHYLSCPHHHQEEQNQWPQSPIFGRH